MKKILLAAIVVGLASFAEASDITVSTIMVNEVLTSTRSFVVDTNQTRIDQLSAQIVYSSASPNTVTFIDGKPSTGSITVTSLTGLTTTYANNSITVISTSGLSDQYLYFRGYPINLIDKVTTTATGTAVNIRNFFNTYYSDIVFCSTNAPSAVVTCTATVTGVTPNSWTLTSSTPAAVSISKPTFTGGYDNASITIAGITLQANIDFFPGGTTTTAATAIANAINSNGTLNKMVRAQSTTNVVRATSTFTGYLTRYDMATSSQAVLTLSGSTLVTGTDSDIVLNVSSNTAPNQNSVFQLTRSPYISPSNAIYKPTNWGAGQAVLFTQTSGSFASLTNNATYYASNITPTSFSLVDTATGAIAGLKLTLSTQTQAGNGTFALTPLAITGTFSLVFQESNDGVNYHQMVVTIGTTTTNAAFTYATPFPQTSNLLKFGDLYTRYIRFLFSAPAANRGGVNTNIIIRGKNNP